MEIADFLSEMGSRCLFHFTDVRNLPLIRKHGLLAYGEMLARGIQPPFPGGDAASRFSDARRGLDQYVHLCFTEDHPMVFKAQAEGRIGSFWFLRIASEVVRAPGAWGCAVASNRADAKVLPLAEALDQMDCKLILAGQSAATSQGRLHQYNEARKYEVLIPREVPVSLILDF